MNLRQGLSLFIADRHGRNIVNLPLDLESPGTNDQQNARSAFPPIWILSDWSAIWLT